MKEKIRAGYIGLGRRGLGCIESNLRHMDDVDIVAVCDLRQEAMDRACELLEEEGKARPIMTTNYKDILAMEDIDAVFIMNGWQERYKMAIEFMYAGKYTAIEVGCAYDISECYEIINAYEKTGTPIMMLENSCYGRKEMMLYNLVDKGLFGEIVHCDGGYHHYLPGMDLFVDSDYNYRHYRLDNYIYRNCEQYPTHEFGPISKILKLNRGNKMLTLSSFASKACGLKAYAKEKFGEDSEYAKIDYKQGDIVTTIITCANGETIHLCLDTTIPRAYYSRNLTVRGTNAMYTEDTRTLYFAGEEEARKDNEAESFEKYDHPLYAEYIKKGTRGTHSGGDWLAFRGFIESVKRGTNTPIDAYDTVAWMSIAPLSEASIAKGGAPVNVPDFTRGKWMNREPVVRGKYCLDEVCIDNETKIY